MAQQLESFLVLNNNQLCQTSNISHTLVGNKIVDN